MSVLDVIKMLRRLKGLKNDMTLTEACEEFHLNLRDAKESLEQAGMPAISENDVLTACQTAVLELKCSSNLQEEGDRQRVESIRQRKEKERKDMEYYAKNGLPVPVIGMNNGRVESKAKLRERLAEVAKTPTKYFYFDGAMCYSPAFPDKEAVIKHKCPTCGTIYKYKEQIYSYSSDRYAIDEELISKYVDEIKALGYDISVEHMCSGCYEKKYGIAEPGLSISVLHFKHIDEDTDIVNIVDPEDMHILAEFLKGNNAYKGYHDQTTWINKNREVIEHLLGIKIEEE